MSFITSRSTSDTCYGGVEFGSVGAAQEHVRGLALSRVGLLKQQSQRVLADMVARRHPHPEVFPSGTLFEVRLNKLGDRTCLVAVTPQRVVWLKVSRMFGEALWGRFSAACRASVRDQTRAAASKFWSLGKLLSGEPVLCPVTLQPMTPGTSDVDHVAPMSFASIVHLFDLECCNKGLFRRWSDEMAQPRPKYGDLFTEPEWVKPLSTLFVQDSEYDQSAFNPADGLGSELITKFQEFHQREAVLRVVSSHANREVLPALARANERGDFDY